MFVDWTLEWSLKKSLGMLVVISPSSMESIFKIIGLKSSLYDISLKRSLTRIWEIEYVFSCDFKEFRSLIITMLLSVKATGIQESFCTVSG